MSLLISSWMTSNCWEGGKPLWRNLRKKFTHNLEAHDWGKEWRTEDHVGQTLYLVFILFAHTHGLRMKSREHLLLKPRAQNRYSNYGKYIGMTNGLSFGWYRPRDGMDRRRSCANFVYWANTCQLVLLQAKHDGSWLLPWRSGYDVWGPRGICKRAYKEKWCFFCKLERHFKSDCNQIWDAVADAKHPRLEEALSRVKVIRARLM